MLPEIKMRQDAVLKNMFTNHWEGKYVQSIPMMLYFWKGIVQLGGIWKSLEMYLPQPESVAYDSTVEPRTQDHSHSREASGPKCRRLNIPSSEDRIKAMT